ncbi:MAG: hypothetical protein A3B14_01375 [Candidatus Zambryskibacteria bacterium RIFCSPLOWO2_01_FULL_45_21]|uniref:Uncharacterized protein n=1 Tax=Candidatus Zambryskibacteria bacterium RIFCSPLOWO2_01_FULL_45_21 TaxID=1802761 RepID=A0A1G2U3Y3_9BACT|nr:MAG: hypothetical protein A3B14_01375 [Candidatus Zambryskibacteria bacterium RIFCSPLOWO2_01_FULL_45_21]
MSNTLPRLVAEVEPMRIGCGWKFDSVDDIPRFVEEPLIKAVTTLFLKNIHSSQTSANKHDALNHGRAYIELDIASLALENLVTLAEISLGPEIVEQGGEKFGYIHHGLQIPLTPETTIEQLEEESLALAALLAPQEAWRAKPLTFAQTKQLLLDRGEEAVDYRHPALVQSSDLRNWKNEQSPYFYVQD